MKRKIIAVICLIVTVIMTLTIAACEEKGTERDNSSIKITVLGDSIAEGILGPTPIIERDNYAYISVVGQINGFTYRNRAVSGHKTGQMLEYISSEKDETAYAAITTITESDVIVVSILGNDLLQVGFSKYIMAAMETPADFTEVDELLSVSYGNIEKIVARLKELNPEIRIDRTSTQGMMETVFGREECYSLTKELSARKSRLYRENCNPDRLLASLFTDYGFIPEKDRWEMLHDLYMLASGCMDVDYLGVDLFRYLTEDESFSVWEVKNTMMYLQSGPSEEFGARALSDAKPTLRHIVSEADKAISKGDISATLRYGHDQNLVPLAALMGIEGCNIVDADGKDLYESWCDFLITPMAANIQLIFFRSGSSDKILVKILHNEKEVGIEGEEPVSFPYYDWEDLRCRFLSAVGKN